LEKKGGRVAGGLEAASMKEPARTGGKKSWRIHLGAPCTISRGLAGGGRKEEFRSGRGERLLGMRAEGWGGKTGVGECWHLGYRKGDYLMRWGNG